MSCQTCRIRRTQVTITEEDLRNVARLAAARGSAKAIARLPGLRAQVDNARSMLADHEAECVTDG